MCVKKGKKKEYGPLAELMNIHLGYSGKLLIKITQPSYHGLVKIFFSTALFQSSKKRISIRDFAIEKPKKNGLLCAQIR